MATASSVLSTRIFSALRTAAVATQAGVASGTWSSTSTTRVFRGIAGWLGGRNRGRLPFIEFDIESQGFTEENPQGGTINQAIRLRVHVGGQDPAVAAELAIAILAAGIAAIRSETTDNLVALGNGAIEPAQFGPWGVSRDAVLQVQQSYGRTDYEVT